MDRAKQLIELLQLIPENVWAFVLLVLSCLLGVVSIWHNEVKELAFMICGAGLAIFKNAAGVRE